MNVDQLFNYLREKFGPKVVRLVSENVDPWIEILPEAITEIGQFLRDDPKLAFDYLNCISAVDYPPAEAQKTGTAPRIELLYHLTSMSWGHRVVLKVLLPRWKDGIEGQLPEVPSVSSIWPAGNWHEREIFDLMGVRFLGHPDLRRILCPDDWEGHPLRKDYKMPDEYRGIPLR
jgi:NADH-quinone oxidoreductase subunit C